VKYQVLATDYDGTLAHDGKVDDQTIAALRRLRKSGRKLVMVTGRELEDLFNTFAHTHLFECIVAENGALLYDPARDNRRLIAAPPPPAFVEALRKKGIPLSVGHCIVATVEPHEHAVLDVIRDLGLEWHVIFNKGSVMALPSGVTKATGLIPALKDLGMTPAQTVGVGDAENDHAFMRKCGLSAAVANALESVKADADVTTSGARGAGVTELIDRLIANDLEDVKPRPSVHRAAVPA
jgi:hydroxymethylpyrimidine pyrophosphatase-like HAD family hydrolase